MKKPTIVLLCGYARAGKDTFALGMATAAAPNLVRTSFAYALKEAADIYLSKLNVYCADQGQTFHAERFKLAHRNFLVEAGRTARSINQDVFADCLVERVNGYENTHVAVTDWRYQNEYEVVKRDLGGIGWRVVTVWVETIGTFAANEEEALTIAEIRRNLYFEHEFFFRPNSPDAVRAEGHRFASTLGL
jgi:hypothetical protein